MRMRDLVHPVRFVLKEVVEVHVDEMVTVEPRVTQTEERRPLGSRVGPHPARVEELVQRLTNRLRGVAEYQIGA